VTRQPSGQTGGHSSIIVAGEARHGTWFAGSGRAREPETHRGRGDARRGLLKSDISSARCAMGYTQTSRRRNAENPAPALTPRRGTRWASARRGRSERPERSYGATGDDAVVPSSAFRRPRFSDRSGSYQAALPCATEDAVSRRPVRSGGQGFRSSTASRAAGALELGEGAARYTPARGAGGWPAAAARTSTADHLDFSTIRRL